MICVVIHTCTTCIIHTCTTCIIHTCTTCINYPRSMRFYDSLMRFNNLMRFCSETCRNKDKTQVRPSFHLTFHTLVDGDTHSKYGRRRKSGTSHARHTNLSGCQCAAAASHSADAGPGSASWPAADAGTSRRPRRRGCCRCGWVVHWPPCRRRRWFPPCTRRTPR